MSDQPRAGSTVKREGVISRAIRRLWCRRHHAWQGYEMTAEEREAFRGASSLGTGSWWRPRSCGFCKDLDDLPRRFSASMKRELLERAAWGVADMNVRLGPSARVLAPGSGWCFKCGTPWRFVHEHSTNYSQSSGCFPLCEKCWEELTPEERLPYYRQLWNQWVSMGTDKDDGTWDQIEAAVMAGL